MKTLIFFICIVSLIACKKQEVITDNPKSQPAIIGRLTVYSVGLPSDSFRYEFGTIDGSTPFQIKAGNVENSPFQIKLTENTTLKINYKTNAGSDTSNTYQIGDTITYISDSLPATVR